MRLLALAILFAPASLWAQAWTTPRGESNFGLYYQYTQSDTHINREGKSRTDLGSERIHSLLNLRAGTSIELRPNLDLDISAMMTTTARTSTHLKRLRPAWSGDLEATSRSFRRPE